MKNISNIILIILFPMMVFVSCKKDEVIAPPSITATELGYDNSKTVYPGSDLHIEAAVLAEGKIARILVEIHPEGEHGAKSAAYPYTESWEFDSTYTGKYAGVKNTEFHEHMDVPATADTGHYHFHFIVTDMEGNQTVWEEELHVTFPTDHETPVVVVDVAPGADEQFSNGQTITISGIVTDDIAIAGIYIALVAENQGLADSLVNHSNTISILHTHDFHDPASVTFQAQIVVGAAFDNDAPEPKPIVWIPGKYYILVKSPDAYGGNVGFSQHFPIEIK
jgi:hypothetical protein